MFRKPKRKQTTEIIEQEAPAIAIDGIERMRHIIIFSSIIQARKLMNK